MVGWGYGSCVDDPLLPFGSATAIATAIRERRISSVEAVTACLARIDEVDPALHALVRRAPDALERAAAADAALARGEPAGPLHGVPCTIKDSLDTAGLGTSVGTLGWRDRVPDRDATVVARLKAAGAIVLGKTNTPEFTWSDETENLIVGPSNNPYDLSRSPGGSSGGAAAIVAAGGSPFDIGSDTGDSIRQPAHVCGIVGLKPTSGRVPRTGHTPSYRGLLQGLTQLGPMTRRVEDIALLLPLIAGPDGEDPHVPPAPLGEPSTVDVGALRIAWFTDNGLHAPTPETQAAVRDAATALRDVGAILIEVVPPGLERAPELWQRLVDADGKAWLHRLMAAAGTEEPGSFAHRGDYRPEPIPSADLTELVEDIDDLRGRLRRWLRDERIDLVLGPAMPQPAVHHGESYAPWFADSYSDVHNLTGWPALVVRGGTAPGRLPIGVQLVANPWREDVAIAAAFVVEAASGGWQRPPL